MKIRDSLQDLKNNVISVIGGDARQLFLAQALADQGYKISAYALTDRIPNTFSGVKTSNTEKDDFCDINSIFANNQPNITICNNLQETVTNSRAVILPFPLSPDGITLNCSGENKPSLREIFASISESCGSNTRVYGGAIKEKSREIAASFGIDPVDYGAFDEIALENAVPTAEAAVQLAMQLLNVTVRGAFFTVIGYGRCGSELARLLKAMGGNVCAVARSGKDRAKMRNDGVTALDFGAIGEAVNSAYVTFNTVPFNILDCDILSKLSEGRVIIELASAPGGVDRECAAHYGVKVIHAPSLPGKYAPKTAAEIIARALIPIL